MGNRIFVFDTSAFIELFRLYNLNNDLFSQLKDRLVKYIENHKIKTNIIVLEELHKKEDVIYNFVKSFRNFLIDKDIIENKNFEGIIEKLNKQFRHCQNIISNEADPFVVTQAVYYSKYKNSLIDKEVFLVSEERVVNYKNNSESCCKLPCFTNYLNSYFKTEVKYIPVFKFVNIYLK